MRGLSEGKIKKLLSDAEHQKNERDICLYSSLLSQLEDVNPWRSMDDAPKNRRILLFIPSNRRAQVMAGVWNAVNEVFIPDLAIGGSPTHWRELPDPPVAEVKPSSGPFDVTVPIFNKRAEG